MSNYKAVFFDLDGTLTDVHEFIMQAFEYSLAKHHVSVPSRSEIARHVSKPLADCYIGLTSETIVDHFMDAYGLLRLRREGFKFSSTQIGYVLKC